MKTSPAFDQRIRESMDRMAKITAQPLNCRIVIESPHRHSARRRCFVVRMQVFVSGRQILVCRTHCDDPAHADPYVALRDAFRAARRKLIHVDYLSPRNARASATGRFATPTPAEGDGSTDEAKAAGRGHVPEKSRTAQRDGSDSISARGASLSE